MLVGAETEGGGEGVCSSFMSEMCLMGAAMYELRCLGCEQRQEFTRLPECTSEAEGGEAVWLGERLRATKWVKQVSPRGGKIAVTFSAHAQTHRKHRHVHDVTW